VIAGAGAAGSANYAVQLLQAGNQLQQAVVAKAGKVRAKAAAQDVGSSFGNLHA
jgi:hypothetical protein